MKVQGIFRPVIKLFSRLGFSVIEENDDYAFHAEWLPPARGIRFFLGGWHSDRYFEDIKEDILKAFHFDESNIDEVNAAVVNRIRVHRSVAVQVRRGDFHNAENYQKFGSVCTLNYFVLAIEKMRSMVENPHFFFFTNDPSWVREHFSGDVFSVVDVNHGMDSWKDMFLISQCAHNICSNGSFSWWSAYLNGNQRKIVIVPRNFLAGRYFEDVYPKDWIKLSDY